MVYPYWRVWVYTIPCPRKRYCGLYFRRSKTANFLSPWKLSLTLWRGCQLQGKGPRGTPTTGLIPRLFFIYPS